MTTKTETALLSEKKDGVLTLTLNRPQTLNALNRPLLGLLAEALKGAERDRETRVLVLTGAGRAFSSGADLADLKKDYESGMAPELGEELRRHFNPVIAQLKRLEKPTIAAVNGTAAGAGASLAFACDLRLAAAGTKFISAFVGVGLAPDSGMTWAMTRSLGIARALEHAWTAKPILAEDAAACGLINRAVPAAELSAAAAELASRLAAAPPKALALTKRALWRAAENDLDAQLEYEAQVQRILGRTKDHLEGVNAFLEGRKPRFTGE